MPGILDLPPELIVKILSELGWQNAFYSAKERQSDLALAVRIHSNLLPSARYLLYSASSVTIRNSGRSALLAQTLSSRPHLAELVRSLVARSEQDVGHPSSITSVLLSTPHLSSLALSAALFRHQLASCQLRTAALAKNLVSFSWTGDQIGEIDDLLAAWPNLKHLSVTVHQSRGIQLQLASKIKPYSLQSLTLSGFGPTRPIFLDEAEITRLLGSTRPNSLRSLSLINARWPPSEYLPAFLAPHLCSLETLILHPFGPSSLADWLIHCRQGQLQHLSYNLNGGQISPNASLPSPYLEHEPVLPSSLRTIEIHGREGYQHLALDRLLVDVELPHLELVRLIGPYSSDAGLKEMHRVCQALGAELQVRRSFVAS